MGDGIDLEVGNTVITTEGFVGRVKEIEGDHITITIPTAGGSEDRKVGADSISKVK